MIVCIKRILILSALIGFTFSAFSSEDSRLENFDNFVKFAIEAGFCEPRMPRYLEEFAENIKDIPVENIKKIEVLYSREGYFHEEIVTEEIFRKIEGCPGVLKLIEDHKAPVTLILKDQKSSEEVLSHSEGGAERGLVKISEKRLRKVTNINYRHKLSAIQICPRENFESDKEFLKGFLKAYDDGEHFILEEKAFRDMFSEPEIKERKACKRSYVEIVDGNPWDGIETFKGFIVSFSSKQMSKWKTLYYKKCEEIAKARKARKAKREEKAKSSQSEDL